MYLDLIKGYRVTIGGYNAPLKEGRENTDVNHTQHITAMQKKQYKDMATCETDRMQKCSHTISGYRCLSHWDGIR